MNTALSTVVNHVGREVPTLMPFEPNVGVDAGEILPPSECLSPSCSERDLGISVRLFEFTTFSSGVLIGASPFWWLDRGGVATVSCGSSVSRLCHSTQFVVGELLTEALFAYCRARIC